MAPPRKVPAGSVKRSVLFRPDQLAALEDAAAAAGADASDVVRGAVDLLFPPDPHALRARARAAAELLRQQLTDRPDLLRVAADGWLGGEPRLPLRDAGTETAALLTSLVGLLRRLGPPPGPAADPEAALAALAGDWAARAPAGLLAVLASPAARCLFPVGLNYPTEGWPVAPPAAVAVAATTAKAEERPAGRPADGVAAAVAGLERDGVLARAEVALVPPKPRKNQRDVVVLEAAPAAVLWIDWRLAGG